MCINNLWYVTGSDIKKREHNFLIIIRKKITYLFETGSISIAEAKWKYGQNPQLIFKHEEETPSSLNHFPQSLCKEVGWHWDEGIFLFQMVCKYLREKAEANKLKDCFNPNQNLIQALGKPSQEPSTQEHEGLPTVSRGVEALGHFAHFHFS